MKPGLRGRRTNAMRLWPAILGLSILSASGLAQKLYPLETLKVEGNQRIPADKIIAASGLKLGALVDKPDFDAARNRLIETGVFESVGYEYQPNPSKSGFNAVVQVIEVGQFFRYRFEDLPVPDATLRAELRRSEQLLGDEIPPTVPILDRYVKIIERVAGVKVAGKLRSDLPGELDIVFGPPGSRPAIAEVRFTGNHVLPTALLTNTLSAVAIGVGYSDSMIRLLLDNSIRPLYEARGRLRVSFPSVVAEKSTKPDVDGVVVTVTVTEGPSYNLAKVSFAGIAKADLPEVEKAGAFQTGDIANFDDVKDRMGRIFDRYRNKGYLRVKGHVDREVHDKEAAVDVLVTIEPGPQFFMGKLEIKGLDIITEPPVRKVWMLKPGAPFQPTYPDSFLKNLRDQGVFDNLGETKSESKIDDTANTVDVTLHFSPAAPQQPRKPGQN